MPLAITGSAMRTSLGDSTETYEALLAGESGRQPLRHVAPDGVNVRYGYHVDATGPERPYRAGGWLTECVAAAAREAGLDCARQRVVAIVGTGLRELRAVERWRADGQPVDPDALHFGAAVRSALPGIEDVVTVSNACSASSHALALAADLIELDEADAVLACGAMLSYLVRSLYTEIDGWHVVGENLLHIAIQSLLL